MSDPAAEFDGPWKEALGLYFRDFVAFFFHDIASEIDWARPVAFQDTELQPLVPEAAVGRGVVDKLAAVWTTGGEPVRVFVHVEVQSQHDADLPQRMYRYNHRLEDKHGAMPVSVAVLGDAGRAWRPTAFTAGRWKCEVTFTFPVAKVLDWSGREDELERSPNPFAAFVLAHLKTVETDASPTDRLEWKLRVMKHLHARGMPLPDLVQLGRLVDWMMTLPPVEAARFDADITAFEKEKQMPFVTPREQRGMDRGMAVGELKGRLDGIRLGLKLRFGADGLALLPRVRQFTDPAAAGAFLDAIETAADLDALRALLPPEPAP